jgi:peptidoglycan hydrolase-like protein with peptidoglycan-binding domain
MRRTGTAIIASILLAPAFAFAIDTQSVLQILLSQVAALKSQIGSLQDKSSIIPGVRVCVAPQRPLKRGDSGDDVANLQIFLAKDTAIYPEASVTGTFGPATERAVQRWQAKYGIVSAGSPASTGYGAVGVRTLALLQQLWQCGGAVSAGWFNANVSGGSVTFSAQIASALPLDQSLYIEMGDGAKVPISISTAVCKTLGGECSSVTSAQHAYSAGTFTATLRRAQTTQQCLIFRQTCIDGVGVCASIPPSCSSNTKIETLATTTLVSSGVAAGSGSSAVTPGSFDAALPSVVTMLSPNSSTILQGGSLTIGWSSTNVPQGATVRLVLSNASGATLGTITQGLKPSGTYWWALPAPAGAACTADAFTCLTQLAAPSCTGDICSLENGAYAVTAQLVYGGKVLSSASGKFVLTNAPIAVSVAIGATSSVGSQNSIGATSSAGVLGALPGDSGTPSAGASCVYSGIPYGNNITLQVGCTDVAGLSCGSFGSLSLTCKNGTWIDASGKPALVPNVTNFNNASTTCSTPWGSQKIPSGQQITYEPFFTSGQYSGINPMPLMQCTSGKWQKCNWDGTGCKPFATI